MRTREVHLVRRPSGEPQPQDFRLQQVELPEPDDGQVLVRNLWMSVDPYMRGRMNDTKSYVPPFALGAALEGGAVGEVLQSRAPSHAPGDLVLSNLGWREHALAPASSFAVVEPIASPSHYLGVLGMPGLTAYAGLLRVGAFAPGDRVFVSGAAGAVGSIVGQLVALRGGTAIGSAGSPQKVAWLREIGFAQAFDYHDGPVSSLLSQAAPDGIDLYFDNVGGEHLEAALGALRVHGRVVVCGMIGQYNATSPPAAPRNLSVVVGKRLSITGMLVRDHNDLLPQFRREVAELVASGGLQVRETVVQGLDEAVQAFRGLLSGANTGKMLVRL